jgi:hypothetical protein
MRKLFAAVLLSGGVLSLPAANAADGMRPRLSKHNSGSVRGRRMGLPAARCTQRMSRGRQSDPAMPARVRLETQGLLPELGLPLRRSARRSACRCGS